MKKRIKVYYFINKYFTAENIRTFLFLLIIVNVVYNQIVNKTFNIANLIDTKILLSLLLLFISDYIAKVINSILQNYLEDYAKQTNDYEYVTKKYPLTNKVQFKQYDGVSIELPYSVLCCKSIDMQIEISDNNEKFYQIPSQIAKNSSAIMKMHKGSVVYNNINIRLDDIVCEGNIIKLFTSRTHYYDSLLTNRAFDTVLYDNMSIREIYEPGPYLKKLSLSKMSNHLGFNGIIVTSDNMVPLVKRSRKVSIAKGMISSSVSASLKSKYAIEPATHRFTCDGLVSAIKAEVLDELNIDISETSNDTIIDSIKYFYIDLLDGGKPQFFISLNIQKDSKEVLKKFYSSDNKDSYDSQVRKDGKEIKLFELNDLLGAKIPFVNNKYDLTKLIILGKEYNMHPNVALSIAFIKEMTGIDNCRGEI